MKQLKLKGNLVNKIFSILLTRFEAKRKDVLTNYVDKSYHIYDVNGIEIEIMLEEQILEDVTIVNCKDNNIIETINKQIT